MVFLPPEFLKASLDTLDFIAIVPILSFAQWRNIQKLRNYYISSKYYDIHTVIYFLQEANLLNIALCEDIPQHANRLAEMIKAYYADRESPVLHMFDRCANFLEEFHKKKIIFDAIFLDIMMPGMNGLEAAEQVRICDDTVPIVFITSAQEHIGDGYEYEALSFLIKPVKEAELFHTLDRIEKRRKVPVAPTLLITSDGRIIRAPLSSIMSIQRQGRKTVVSQTDGKTIFTNQPISDFMSALKSAPNFVRAYQSDYVNLQYIVNVDKKHRAATFADGRTITIGRDRMQPFLDAMVSFLGADE